MEAEVFDDMPTAWISKLSEAAAYGAAGAIGAEGFDVALHVVKKLLVEVNKHFREYGLELDQEGNFKQVAGPVEGQLDLSTLQEELAEMRAEMEKMKAENVVELQTKAG